MDEKSIREYAKLMRECGITGLEINEEKGDLRNTIRLEMNGNSTLTVPIPASAADNNTVSGSNTDKTDDSNVKKIRSSIVGVFYSAYAENADPYVKVGDTVKKGDTLCIIEAMKLMNEIVAEEDCVITEILAENGQTVEYGTELFAYKKIR